MESPRNDALLAGGMPDVYDGPMPGGASWGSSDDPYAPPRSATLSSPRTSENDTRLASRGSRLAARFVDQFLFVLAIVAVVFGGALVEGPFGEGELPSLTIGAGVLLVGWLAFVNLRLMAYEGQTLGKKVCKVRVVQENGLPVPLGRWIGMRSIVPGILASVPVVGVVFGLINVLVIFGAERRCLHDHLAGTKVIAA